MIETLPIEPGDSNEVCAAKTAINMHPHLSPQLQAHFHDGLVSAYEVLHARED